MYAAPRPETVLLAERGIQVTTARLIVGTQTFPLHSIGSVSPLFIPKETVGATMAVVIAVLAGLPMSSCCIWLGESARSFGYTLLVATICMIVIAIAHAATRKTFHGVNVATPLGRVPIAVSDDQAFAQRVLGALNHALSMRG